MVEKYMTLKNGFVLINCEKKSASVENIQRNILKKVTVIFYLYLHILSSATSTNLICFQ